MSPPDVAAPSLAVGADGRAKKGSSADKGSAAERFASLQARLALRGFTLQQCPQGVFIVARWNLHKVLDHADAVEAFAEQVGA